MCKLYTHYYICVLYILYLFSTIILLYNYLILKYQPILKSNLLLFILNLRCFKLNEIGQFFYHYSDKMI